jgi:TupA-like ATPgrasp
MRPPLVASRWDWCADAARPFVRRAMTVLPCRIRTGVSMVRDFRRKFGRYPNLLPRTFSEKALARKLFDRRARLSNWADKYAVRDYVESKLGPAVLPAVYHVTVDPSDIPFGRLPGKYVVKPTHGSGWVYLVRDAAKVNKEELIARCRYWLGLNYYDLSKEWAYKDVPPRIMVQEFLEMPGGAPPADFKLFVFGGKVRVIEVDVDRHSGHKRNLYDPNWTRMDCEYVYEGATVEIPKPRRLQTMIDYAETLSSGIDFVRVDLYEVGDRVYFGELTNIPESGLGQFRPASWDEAFGSFWKLPNFWPANSERVVPAGVLWRSFATRLQQSLLKPFVDRLIRASSSHPSPSRAGNQPS